MPTKHSNMAKLGATGRHSSATGMAMASHSIGLYNPATARRLFAEREHIGLCRHNIPIWPGWGQLDAIAGDWTGHGVSTVGLYNQAASKVYLRNENTTGYADITFQYGQAGANWRPIAGILERSFQYIDDNKQCDWLR